MEDDSLAGTFHSSQAASMLGAARPINPAITEQQSRKAAPEGTGEIAVSAR